MALSAIHISLVEFTRNMGMGHKTQNEGKQHKQITHDIFILMNDMNPTKKTNKWDAPCSFSRPVSSSYFP
jgi:hypothetical protein